MSELLERCQREFGTTENPHQAGFILPSGDLLDLGAGTEIRGTASRLREHTDVGLCFPDDYPVRRGSYLNTFIEDTNSVRISVNHLYYGRGPGCALQVMLDTFNRPTRAQVRRLEELERECEEFYYDVTKRGGYCEAPNDPPPTLKKALRDLERCRRGGS